MLFNSNLSLSDRVSYGSVIAFVALGLINYTNESNEFEYTLDATSNNIITNQGSGLTTYDGLNHSGESLEVSATQQFSVGTSGQTVALYRTNTSRWDYQPAPYTVSIDTYGHIACLASTPSVADQTELEANIHSLSDMYFNRATGLTSIVKADIEALYIPQVLQAGTLQDIVGTADITIPNYAATVYTNVDQNPKGQQTTNITFDGTGLATGVTYDTMDWGGNHYMDCQFMPPHDSAWEMDIVFDLVSVNSYFAGIRGPATSSHFYFRIVSSDIYLYFGDKLTTIAHALGIVHIRVEYNGSGDIKYVIDNSTSHTAIGSTYTYDANETFYLGAGSSAGSFFFSNYTGYTGYFQYTEGTRTAAERTAAYDAAKLQHPTLP